MPGQNKVFTKKLSVFATIDFSYDLRIWTFNRPVFASFVFESRSEYTSQVAEHQIGQFSAFSSKFKVLMVEINGFYKIM